MAAALTLAAPCELRGVGLHLGLEARCCILPAQRADGLCFARVDLPGSDPIPARAAFVVDSTRATTLGRGAARVGTVEHLLAALSGLGVFHARVEVEGPELPILDGSASPWVEALLRAGLRALDVEERPFVVKETLAWSLGDAWLRLCPDAGLFLDVSVDFPHPLLRARRMALRLDTPECFVREIAWARTFALSSEIEALHARGLARGGSLENALVMGDDGPLNPGGMRGPDEPLRHKILDLLGDLALLGRPLRARVEASKPGHALLARVARDLDPIPQAARPDDASATAGAHDALY